MSPRYSRRRYLGAVTGIVGASTVGRYGTGRASAQRTATIYLGGDTANWVGREPSGISEEANPTLTLREGETYVLAWENVDGNQHNVVIEDGEGENIVDSPLMNNRGEIQLVEFTATSEMASYYCVVHPTSMRGDVEIVPSDSDEGIPPDQEVTLPDEATPTPTPADTPTETPTDTPTDTPTPEPSDGGGESGDGGSGDGGSGDGGSGDDGDGGSGDGGDSEGGSGPGFGVLAALAGLLGAGAGLARRRSE
jgi:PGF-CTERM protein